MPHRFGWILLQRGIAYGIRSRMRISEASGGFSLIEVMIIISVVAGLATAGLTLAPQFFKKTRNKNQVHLLHQADRQLRGFAVANGRLPCPDINGDGFEQCTGGAAVGRLPYKTLGLGSADLGHGRIPPRYGVYRNAAASADLAVLKDRFNPTDADGNTTTLNQTNSLDLCTALDNAAGSAASTGLLFTRDAGGTSRNVAYAVAVAGTADADGVHGLFDGLNGQAGVGFAATNIAPDAAYDDRVLARSFSSLGEGLNCNTVRNSLNMLANAVAIQDEVTAQAADTASGTILGASLAGAGLVLAGVDVALAGVSVASAGVALGTAATGLAVAIGTCIIGVGCAEIPTFTAAVAAATAGLAAASAGLAATAAALVASITATALYTAVAIRANAATGSSSVDLAQSVTDLQIALATANTNLTKAQTDETAALTQANTTQTSLNTSRNNLIAQLDAKIANDNAALAATPPPSATVQAQLQADINNVNTAKNSLQTAINAEITLDQKLQALQTAQTQATQAQSSLDSKTAALTTLQSQKACNDAGQFYNFAVNPAVCRARISSDPPQTVSQAQIDSAIADKATAQTQLTNANAAQTSAQTAYDGAITTAASTRSTAQNNVATALSPTAPAASVNSILDLQRQLPQRQRAADAATQTRIQAQARVDSLQANLAQMQCLAAGNVYDTSVTPPTCKPPSASSGGAAVTPFNGAGAILKAADNQGAAR